MRTGATSGQEVAPPESRIAADFRCHCAATGLEVSPGNLHKCQPHLFVLLPFCLPPPFAGAASAKEHQRWEAKRAAKLPRAASSGGCLREVWATSFKFKFLLLLLVFLALSELSRRLIRRASPKLRVSEKEKERERERERERETHMRGKGGRHLPRRPTAI